MKQKFITETTTSAARREPFLSDDEITNLSATGTTNGVKVYRALLTQTGTDAPVATVLANTLGGTVEWYYDGTGQYTATLTGVFLAGKTCLPSVGTVTALDGITTVVVTAFYRVDDDNVRLQTAIADIAVGTLTLSDGQLTGTYVEILVYP